jgi:hypothetical protein
MSLLRQKKQIAEPSPSASCQVITGEGAAAGARGSGIVRAGRQPCNPQPGTLRPATFNRATSENTVVLSWREYCYDITMTYDILRTNCRQGIVMILLTCRARLLMQCHVIIAGLRVTTPESRNYLLPPLLLFPVPAWHASSDGDVCTSMVNDCVHHRLVIRATTHLGPTLSQCDRERERERLR